MHAGGIDDADIGRHFADLDGAKTVLLAVSGGPDSTALMCLAIRWAQTLGRDAPGLHVATVDHQLRAGATEEAEMVAKAAAELGLPHTTLSWAGPKPTTRLQERAREVRYQLLMDHARAIGATHIATGHHADDQAETVLFRLGRGSGITGLAGIRRVSYVAPRLLLVRPLLDLAKAELIAVCRAEDRFFVDDPSNRNPAFARTRLRTQAPTLAGLGFDTPGLVRLSRRLARADAALEIEIDRVEAKLDPRRRADVYTADLSEAQEAAAEIKLRLLHRAISHVAGDRAIRLERLETLADALWSALDAGLAFRGTLAGTRVALATSKMLTVSAEAGRRRGLEKRPPAPLLRPN